MAADRRGQPQRAIVVVKRRPDRLTLVRLSACPNQITLAPEIGHLILVVTYFMNLVSCESMLTSGVSGGPAPGLNSTIYSQEQPEPTVRG